MLEGEMGCFILSMEKREINKDKNKTVTGKMSLR